MNILYIKPTTILCLNRSSKHDREALYITIKNGYLWKKYEGNNDNQWWGDNEWIKIHTIEGAIDIQKKVDEYLSKGWTLDIIRKNIVPSTQLVEEDEA